MNNDLFCSFRYEFVGICVRRTHKIFRSVIVHTGTQNGPFGLNVLYADDLSYGIENLNRKYEI